MTTEITQADPAEADKFAATPEQRKEGVESSESELALIASLEAAKPHFETIVTQSVISLSSFEKKLGLEQPQIDQLEAAVQLGPTINALRDRLDALINQVNEGIREKRKTAETVIGTTQAEIDQYAADHVEDVQKLAEAARASFSESAVALLQHEGDRYRQNPIETLAVADQLYNASAESSLSNIEAARQDVQGLNETIQAIEVAIAEPDIDRQYALMQILFAKHPDRYIAAMEKLTYDLSHERSRIHADHKIEQVWDGLSEKLRSRGVESAADIQGVRLAFERLQLSLAKEVVPKMLDTHATDLPALMSLIRVGRLDTPHSRKSRNEGVKSTKGDDFKLAGSLSIFSYLGSYFEVDKDVYLELNSQWLDKQERSYYLTEDYVVKPPKDAKSAESQLRKSFGEKLGEVMQRNHAKEYLASKITGFLLEKAAANGMSAEDLSNLQVDPGALLSYYAEHSDIQQLPKDLLGGRPEGHLPFAVPLGECRAKIPRETLAGVLASIDAKILKAVKDQRTPEVQKYEGLKTVFSALAANLGLETTLLQVIQRSVTDEMSALEARPQDDAIRQQIENLQKFVSQIEDYDIKGDQNVQEAKNKLYTENLGYTFSDKVRVPSYTGIQFTRLPGKDSGKIYANGQVPGFVRSLAGELQQQGIDASVDANGSIVYNGDPQTVQEKSHRFLEAFLPLQHGWKKVLSRQITELDLYQLGYAKAEISVIIAEKRSFTAAIERLLESNQIGSVINGRSFESTELAGLKRLEQASRGNERYREIVLAILLKDASADQIKESGIAAEKIAKVREVLAATDATALSEEQLAKLIENCSQCVSSPDYAKVLKEQNLMVYAPLIGMKQKGFLPDREALISAARSLNVKRKLVIEPDAEQKLFKQLAQTFEL